MFCIFLSVYFHDWCSLTNCGLPLFVGEIFPCLPRESDYDLSTILSGVASKLSNFMNS